MTTGAAVWITGLASSGKSTLAGGLGEGADLGYEPPLDPEVVATGGHDDGAADRILALIRAS